MGMFDHIKCNYPLPINKDTKNLLFQTKDTPAQWLDLYEIREDGTLWHETYDIEDRSDPNAEGFRKFIGSMTKINKGWEPMECFTGEIRFYTCFGEENKEWVEFSSYFVKGKLKELHSLGEKELPQREEKDKYE
jgi:hypothetical protein